jgi:hypothetical protein
VPVIVRMQTSCGKILDIYVGSQDERVETYGTATDSTRLAPQIKSQTEPNTKSDHFSAVGRLPGRLTANDWEGRH